MVDFSQFHFLNPLWLWALLPALLLWLALFFHQKQQGNWAQVIDPEFHPLLLKGEVAKQANLLPLIGIGLLWLLAILALAGPTWKQVKIPASETQSGSVILLDLSLSMLAEDLKPNRLTQARFKLLDLLEQHPEIPMGLVAYAGSAHPLVPISKDNGTLKGLLPSLHPFLMPQYGSDPVQAFQTAWRMLQGAHVKHGHIIWVTDDLEPEQQEEIARFIKTHPVSLSILVVGTPEGGPIPIPKQGLLKDNQDKTVLAKVPYQRFEQLAKETGAKWTPLKLTDEDLNALLPPKLGEQVAKSAKQQQKGQAPAQQSATQWQNMGPYLLWLLIPLFALGFRKGWLAK